MRKVQVHGRERRIKPRIDRGATDMPRLPGKVMRVANDLYEITTAYSILNDCCRASDLKPYSGDV